MLSTAIQGDVEFITKQASGGIKQDVRKRSAKQREREKKKLGKLLERKEKQGKMREIMAALEMHKGDVKDYAGMQSARNLG